MIMVRYADDTVVGFQHESDARRFRDAMRDRLRELRANPLGLLLQQVPRGIVQDRLHSIEAQPIEMKFLIQ